MNFTITHLTETTSTLDAIRQAAASGAPEGTVITAERQTAGRGRMGRLFASEPGGLYFSLLLRPAVPPERLNLITVLTGLAVLQGLDAFSPVPPEAKWPNDILAGNRKMCGILAEARFTGEGCPSHVALGIGVNVAQERFPRELSDIAVSLRQLGAEAAPETVLAALLSELDTVLTEGLYGDPVPLLERYRRRCRTLGQTVSYLSADGPRVGLAVGIDEQARLTVQHPDGSIEDVGAGEVSIVRIS